MKPCLEHVADELGKLLRMLSYLVEHLQNLVREGNIDGTAQRWYRKFTGSKRYVSIPLTFCGRRDLAPPPARSRENECMLLSRWVISFQVYSSPGLRVWHSFMNLSSNLCRKTSVCPTVISTNSLFSKVCEKLNWITDRLRNEYTINYTKTQHKHNVMQMNTFFCRFQHHYWHPHHVSW